MMKHIPEVGLIDNGQGLASKMTYITESGAASVPRDSLIHLGDLAEKGVCTGSSYRERLHF